MKDLVEIHFPEAEKIRVVLDNLNTHSPAAYYEAFSPQQARYLTKKLEFLYPPEHSSWLNTAEVEISVMTEQCLGRRLGSQAFVASEVGAWKLNGTPPGQTSIGVSPSRMPGKNSRNVPGERRTKLTAPQRPSSAARYLLVCWNALLGQHVFLQVPIPSISS
jgi:hypothetical protein